MESAGRIIKKQKLQHQQEREYIVNDAAKVYKAAGEEYAHLSILAMEKAFSGKVVAGREPFDIFVVEKFDLKYSGKHSICTSVTEIEGFHTLDGNCAMTH